MKIAATLALLALTGCSSTMELVIDQTGVDPGQYSRDLADCAKNRPFVAADHPDAKCMRGKGYKVLFSHA